MERNLKKFYISYVVEVNNNYKTNHPERLTTFGGRVVQSLCGSNNCLSVTNLEKIKRWLENENISEYGLEAKTTILSWQYLAD